MLKRVKTWLESIYNIIYRWLYNIFINFQGVSPNVMCMNQAFSDAGCGASTCGFCYSIKNVAMISVITSCSPVGTAEAAVEYPAVSYATLL